MQFTDLWRYAWRNVMRRPSRAVAICLGYAIVTATTVATLAAARATRDNVVRTLWDIGAHTMAFLPLCAGQGCSVGVRDPHEGFEANGAPTQLFSAKVVERLRRSPHIADASPYLLFRIRPRPNDAGWLIGGFDASRPTAFAATVAAPSQVTEGRFLKPEDRGVVMLDQEFAQTHRFRVGDSISLGDLTVTVVGIVNPPIRPGKAHLYMTFEDARAAIIPRLLTPFGDAVNAVLVESRSAFDHPAAQQEIRQILGTQSRLTSYSCGIPGSRAMRVHLNTAAAIMLLVAIGMSLLVLRLQSAEFLERRFEIAVLKAIGWSARAVGGPLAIEVLLLACAGCCAGAAAAAAFVGWMPHVMASWAGVRIDTLATLLSLAWTIGLGLLSVALGVGTAMRTAPARLLRRP